MKRSTRSTKKARASKRAKNVSADLPNDCPEHDNSSGVHAQDVGIQVGAMDSGAPPPRDTTLPPLNEKGLTSAMHVGDIRVSADEDSVCHISGIAVLPKNCLVVTDWNNQTVKLVKVNLNKVISRVPLSSQPLDVTSIQPNQVAVSLGNEQKIEIYNVSDTLTITKTIHIPGTTFSGICYDSSKFFVVSEVANDVKIVDMTGKIVKTVSTDSYNDPLFKSPRYIMFRRFFYPFRSYEDIFITDQAADTVTCMTSTFEINWVHRQAGLCYPVGISVGKEGDILVCSRQGRGGGDAGVVHVLSRHTGLLLKKIELGVPEMPQALCVFGDQMWISTASTWSNIGDFVRMFQIEYIA